MALSSIDAWEIICMALSSIDAWEVHMYGSI